MKAVTVQQPWAQLLILGAQRYHLRSWQTQHRGPLLVHAGRRLITTRCKWPPLEPWRALLKRHGLAAPEWLPRGALLGSVTVEDCLPLEQLLYADPEAVEPALGLYPPGLWAWKLRSPCPFAKPIPCRGALGIFDVPDTLLSTSPGVDWQARFALPSSHRPAVKLPS